MHESNNIEAGGMRGLRGGIPMAKCDREGRGDSGGKVLDGDSFEGRRKGETQYVDFYYNFDMQ